MPETALEVASLGKHYLTSNSPHAVFQNLSFVLPKGGRLGLLGRNGQGKSTLIRILGGVVPASEGTIRWNVRPSWPIGFGGGFQGSLSGMDNIRFISRIYEADYRDVLVRVEGFAELGDALKEPVKHYSSGMRARLAFGLSLAIDFDCYLIDELVAVGDARFQEKCNRELFEIRAQRTFIIASHDMGMVRSLCDQVLIIESGKAKIFHDVEEAVEIYHWLRAA